MFNNNSFGGYNSNTFNPVSKNLQTGNIAGINKGPTSVAGINKQPNNLVGMNKKSIASKLLSYDPSKYYIILGVGKYERNKLHHYVALDYVDASNNEIYIMDPASTKYTKLYDVYKVYSAHIYEKKD